MAVGVFNTAQIPEQLARASFSAMITRTQPNGQAPLFGLTALMKEEVASQIEHGFYGKTSFVAAAATAADANVISIAPNSNILVGMVFQNDATKENVLVTGVNGNTSIQVQRSLGNVAAQAIAGSANFWLVGNAYEESSLRPQSLIVTPDRFTNFTQIFRNTWTVSESTRATQLIAGGTAVEEARMDCATFHSVQMESAMLFGQRFQGSRNGQPFRTLDGIVSRITQSAPGNITTAGATTNYTQLEAAGDPVFNQVTNPAGLQERVMFVGGTARRVLHQIFRANGTYFIEDGNTSWGLQFDRFKLPRGSFNIIEHQLFNAYGTNSSWSKMAMMFDMNTFNLAYMAGRKTTSRDFNVGGSVVVDNGIDAVGGTLTTEVTCLVKNAPANGIIYNLTSGVAG
jgi:hypothetical protein